jgi:hypothetical protein
MKKDDDRTLWIGPIGPIHIVKKGEPGFDAEPKPIHIAQLAIDCPDLVELVLHHPDPLVRGEAVPRLKARFPKESSAHGALIQAVSDSDEGVRCAAISAVADLALPEAGDLLAAALSDAEPDVRFFAAIGLQILGDFRAPDDPEAFAYRTT